MFLFLLTLANATLLDRNVRTRSTPPWAPDGPPRDRRHRHPSRDHRRLLRRATGRPARLPPTAADRTHLRRDDRPDLRPLDQLDPDGVRAHARLRLPDPAALAFAFGTAVTGTITITTLLFFYLYRHKWGKPLWLVAGIGGAFLIVDLFFLAEPDQARPRRLAATADRRPRLHRPAHLATRPHDRHPPPRTRRGIAARIHRPPPRPPTAAAARPWDRRLPQPRQRDRPARDARQRRAQPRPARTRRHRLHRDPDGPLGPRERTPRHRRARLHRRRHHPRQRPLRLPGRTHVPDVLRQLETAEIECPIEVDDANYFLSTIELRAGDEPTMPRWRKRPLRRHLRHHRRRRRILRPAPRSHRDHGLTRRRLSSAVSSRRARRT